MRVAAVRCKLAAMNEVFRQRRIAHSKFEALVGMQPVKFRACFTTGSGRALRRGTFWAVGTNFSRSMKPRWARAGGTSRSALCWSGLARARTCGTSGSNFGEFDGADLTAGVVESVNFHRRVSREGS
jgi:hypothetical protein